MIRLSTKKMFISFVLPAYNEEDSITELLTRITKSMATITSNYEIVFVVEGNDGTVRKIKEFQKSSPARIYTYYQKEPRGLMKAFIFGFNSVSPETTHIITMDVDLNHYPEELPRLISKAEEGYNIVIGSRALKGGKTLEVPLLKRVLSKFSNYVFNKTFKIDVKDKTSGFRMMDSATVREVSPLVHSKGFEGLMEFLLIAANKKKTFAEVPITMIFRKHGISKVRLFPVGKGYLRLLLQRRKIRSK